MSSNQIGTKNTCLCFPSKLLYSLNLKVDEVVLGMGEVSLAMNDTARDAKYAADTLPQISGSVANIQRNVETLVEFTVRGSFPSCQN